VAVIIGAMLVAPLMGPILGMALASIARRPGLYRRAVISLAAGVVLALALSAAVAFAARQLPFGALREVPAEVQSRAQPSVFDLGIALAGGAAGAYAAVKMKGAAALVGVAIATALMPPLCSVGIGIAINDASLSEGAGLLFLTNLVAIVFAALLVFGALGLRSSRLAWTAAQGVLTAIGVLLVAGALTALTIRTVNDAREQGRVRDAVARQLEGVLPGSQLLDLERETSQGALKLKIRVQVPDTVNQAQVRALQENVADDLHRTVKLTFVGVPTLELAPVQPVASRSPTLTPSATATPTRTPSATPTEPPAPSPTATTAPPPTPPLLGNSRP
jgi:uncharacterized hydrophobic protein (TIGR00271 family)